MRDPEILKACGSTTERLKEVFTAVPYEKGDLTLTRDQKIRINKNVKLRKYWEERIQNRLTSHIDFALKNEMLYGAVDLAWDSSPINKEIYSLMLYAQGKINLQACAADLDALGCKDTFVSKNDKGEIVGVNLPKFTDVYVNVVRSILTRRLAAQCNKYNNLWPFFRYESRSTSQVGKLRADIMSSISDIMADQYDYRSHQEQVFRDTLMYAHSIDFLKCAWEKEKQCVRKGESAVMSTGEKNYETRIIREGLTWINPHPTRAFWDPEHPVRTLNSDTGCTYCGYWDVVRSGSIKNNTQFWNRKDLQWSVGQNEMFGTYASYFSRYYCTIKPPPSLHSQMSAENDRKNAIGAYSGLEEDTSIVIAPYFEKIIPSEHGFGTYPHPVWVRFVSAGATSVIHGEFLPSTPAAVCSYNENDSRATNISLAHELLSYQDQMTNLLSLLLLTIKNENFKIVVLDKDTLSPEQMKKFRDQARGKNYYTETLVLETSRSQQTEAGFDLDKIVKLVETRSTTAVDVIFRAMLQLMSLMERLLAMSPQEMGQPAEREISATESNAISRTTETVYNFISDSFDSYRAAQKRIIHDSYMAFGRSAFRVPVMNRYTKQTIVKAGFEVVDEDPIETTMDEPRTMTVLGTKENLVHDYIFTSRDGAERASDLQGAQSLGEVLKSVLPLEAVQGTMTKNQLFEVLNELFRKASVYDFKLEVQDGTGDEPLNGGAGDITGVLEQVTEIVGQHSEKLAQIEQLLTQLVSGARNGQPSEPPTVSRAA